MAKLDRLTRSVKTCGTGAVREAQGGADFGRGIARHRLGSRAPGDHYSGRGEPVGARGDRGADPRRPAPQAKPGPARRQHRLRVPHRADGQHLEPEPGEQAALAEIHQLRRKGTTLRGIAAALNHPAYRTRRGTPWRLETLARVLKQTTVQSKMK